MPRRAAPLQWRTLQERTMRPSRYLPLAALLALVAQPAAANPFADHSGGATAYYQRGTSTYSVAAVDQDFTHRRFVLDYSEQANGWLHLGISMGLAFTEARGEPLLATLEPSGYLFGVFAGARLLDKGGFTVDLGVGYLRETGDTADATDEVTLTVDEGRAQLAVAYRFEAVRVMAGAYALDVSGEVERTGGTPGTATFEGTESSGSFVGVELPIGEGYAIGVRAEAGARSGVVVAFSTSF
jgi:hypothetical protein